MIVQACHKPPTTAPKEEIFSTKIIPMRKDSYPWRTNNSFKLLCDGSHFFPAIFTKIENAKYFVLIEIYLINSCDITQQLINKLLQAAHRGVAIYLLCDDYGARNLSKADRAVLMEAGVHLCLYNRLHFRSPLRYLPRDHRKIIVIDGHTTFVGGLGFTDDFLAPPKNKQWRETVVQIEGECNQDWINAFTDTWEEWHGQNLELPPIPPQTFEHCTQPGHIALSPVAGRREVRRNIINQLRSAQHRVWLSTAYFVPSRKIRRLLRRAAKRGVDVRLILPGSNIDHPGVRYAGRRFYARLLHNNVKIYEYQPRFIHHKVVLIDDWVSIGSANMDRWNLRWNLEANQEIDEINFASQVGTMLLNDIKDCEQLSYSEWCQRTRWGRFLEWFWGKIDLMLVRIKEPKH